jgi:hypothetical protein
MIRLTSLFAVVLTLFALKLHGDELVSPPANESFEGNNFSRFPFRESGVRVQQVFSAAQFSGLFSDQILITDLAFRIDGNQPLGQPFSTTARGLTIQMSTTGADFATASLTFDQNFGPVRTTVLSGDVPLAGIKTTATSFDVVVPLPQPYLYDRRNGNLLIDYQLSGTSVVPLLDYQSNTPGVFNLVGLYDSQSVPFKSSGGLVTKFIFQPVPEPGILTSLVFASVLLVAFKRIRSS